MPLFCIPDFRKWFSCKKEQKPVLTSEPPVPVNIEQTKTDDPMVVKDMEVQTDEALKAEVVIN